MDKAMNQMRPLLMLLITAAALLISGPPGYALDFTLQWAANPEPDIIKYTVYYKTRFTGKRVLSNYESSRGAAEGRSPVDVPLAADENPDPDVVEFTLHGLPSYPHHYFVVTATNSENLESEASNEIATNYSGPGKVYIYSTRPKASIWSDDNTVAIQWVRPSLIPGVSIAGYSTLWDTSSETTLAASINHDTDRSMNSPVLLDGNNYYFHIRALDTVGNWGETKHCGPFWIDTGPPGIDLVDLIFETEVEITYSENNMRNAAIAENYTFDNGMVVADVTDVTGEGRIFSLSLSNFQSNMIYTMTISRNVTDAAWNPIPSNERTIGDINDSDHDGMADDWEISWFGHMEARDGSEDADGDGITDREEYSYAVSNPELGSNRWIVCPVDADSDHDGLPDGFEIDNGLNPADPSNMVLHSGDDGAAEGEGS